MKKVWPECSLPWSEGCGQSLPPPKASFWEGSRCGIRLCLIYVCAIWIKIKYISFWNRIWTLMSVFPILLPQSRSFIPLYESVWDVANHRVKQLRVVLFKLSSNLNDEQDCENDCGMGAMKKKVGFGLNQIPNIINVICQHESDRKEQGLSPDLLQVSLGTSRWRPLCLGLAGAPRGPAKIGNFVSSFSNEDTFNWMRIFKKITLEKKQPYQTRRWGQISLAMVSHTPERRSWAFALMFGFIFQVCSGIVGN